MKTVTLSADEKLLASAEAQARADQTTLNDLFQQWLEDYTTRRRTAANALATIDALRQTVRTGGRTFTRDERNER